jgi:hypothetical protein
VIKLISRLLLGLLILLGLAPSVASAVDIPILTWERGRVQEVILGDTNTSNDWKLQLVGDNTPPVLFTASSKNEAGYLVYSAQIPDTLPGGAYSLESSGGGLPKTIVAGVNLIAAETYDIRKETRDLTFVVGLFTFIKVTLSSLRSRKYSRLSVVKSQSAFNSESINSSRAQRVISELLNLRTNLTQGVQPSLFRYLLGEESQLLLKISRPAFYGLPLLAIVLGFFAGTNAEASGGLEKSNLLFFFLITLLGLIDSFSGIFALFTFWVIQFFNGNIANVNQVLVMVAAAIAWIGPALAARVYHDAVVKDFQSEKSFGSSQGASAIAAVGSAAAATAIFFGGYKLLLSLLGEISDSWEMKPVFIGSVFVIALIKALFISRFMQNESAPEGEKFELVRVVSPQIAMAVFAITFGFAYSWTANASKALITAALFSAPYFILFIRLQAIGTAIFSKLKRNILLESVLAVAASFALYTQIQRLPQLSDQRAEIFLLAAAIPGLIHSIYSSICDSAQREETINP